VYCVSAGFENSNDGGVAFVQGVKFFFTNFSTSFKFTSPITIK
jgi:hypothetical protein